MPHLVILYSGNLDKETDMTALCRTLAAGGPNVPSGPSGSTVAVTPP